MSPPGSGSCDAVSSMAQGRQFSCRLGANVGVAGNGRTLAEDRTRHGRRAAQILRCDRCAAAPIRLVVGLTVARCRIRPGRAAGAFRHRRGGVRDAGRVHRGETPTSGTSKHPPSSRRAAPNHRVLMFRSQCSPARGRRTAVPTQSAVGSSAEPCRVQPRRARERFGAVAAGFGTPAGFIVGDIGPDTDGTAAHRSNRLTRAVPRRRLNGPWVSSRPRIRAPVRQRRG